MNEYKLRRVKIYLQRRGYYELNEYNRGIWSAVPMVIVSMVSMVAMIMPIIIEVTFGGVVELLVSFWKYKTS